MINFDSASQTLRERLGDFNPQLLRELKSRLSWRNSLIAIAISMVAQLLLLLSQFSKLPSKAEIRNGWHLTEYCLAIVNSQCTRDALGNILVNWPKWWREVAFNDSWLMVYGLMIGGVYLLASSFSQEEKRGTLDFIRLTPQQASTIFVGKLLGVPVLVYLGTALALPLQLYAAQQGGFARLYVLSWDILMIAVALLLYLGAILATMWFKAQSIMLAGASAFIAYQVAYSSLYWYLKNYNIGSGSAWYGLPIGNHPFFYLTFAALTSVGIYWLYCALERRYAQAQSTVLSKTQSYGWTAMLHLFLMGFYFYGIDTAQVYAAKTIGQKLPLAFHAPFGFGTAGAMNSFANTVLGLFGLVWLMLLIPLLLPNRQSLIEWSRYHAGRGGQPIRSLLWADRSPGILAVAINVAIASLIWIPMITIHARGADLDKLLLGTAITAVIATLYSSIAHWVLFWQVNNRTLWSVGIIGGLVGLPVLGASLISSGVSTGSNPLFLLSPFVWTSIHEIPGFVSLLILGLLFAVTLWVNLQVQKSLQKVGRSESFQHLHN